MNNMINLQYNIMLINNEKTLNIKINATLFCIKYYVTIK